MLFPLYSSGWITVHDQEPASLVRNNSELFSLFLCSLVGITQMSRLSSHSFSSRHSDRIYVQKRVSVSRMHLVNAKNCRQKMVPILIRCSFAHCIPKQITHAIYYLLIISFCCQKYFFELFLRNICF